MILDIKNNATHRKMYKAAKNDFFVNSAFWHQPVNSVPWANADTTERSKIFFNEFAKSHNARLIVSNQLEWLDITALEFDNEQDYTWFVLKWS